MTGAVSAQPSAAWFEPTRVDDAPAAPWVRTHHAGVFDGRAIEYDAITGEMVLKDEDGQPAATIFSTAYLRTDIEDRTARPIVFFFNGGPGASSSPLHLGVGPVRIPRAGDDPGLAPNPPSPLDAVDMVFVDPVGTGYARLYHEGAGSAFWGIEEDADSLLFFVRDWLARQERSDSPVFLMGESYGSMRVVTMLARAGNLELAGALLLSPALDMTAGTPVVGNNLPYIFLLPSMAATAAYHEVTERGGRSYREIFEQAATFAETGYAAALQRGARLGPEEARRVGAMLAELTGLPQNYLLDRKLRVSGSEFMDALLGEQGLRVGRLDTRITGRIEDYRENRPPANDPSMARGRSGGPSAGERLDDYFSGELNTHIDRPYRTLNLDLNSQWNFRRTGAPRFYLSVVPLLQEAMGNRPALKIFVGGGVFDLGTPVLAARYLATQVDADPDRFSFALYDGGHMVFEHEESRIRLCADIRKFVATTLAADGAD